MSTVSASTHDVTYLPVVDDVVLPAVHFVRVQDHVAVTTVEQANVLRPDWLHVKVHNTPDLGVEKLNVSRANFSTRNELLIIKIK